MDEYLREDLGRVVREAWVAACKEIGDTNPKHLAPWDELGPIDKEIDRRIGEMLYERGRSDCLVLYPHGREKGGISREQAYGMLLSMLGSNRVGQFLYGVLRGGVPSFDQTALSFSLYTVERLTVTRLLELADVLVETAEHIRKDLLEEKTDGSK